MDAVLNESQLSDSDDWPLHSAAARGDVESARRLLSEGADVHAFDDLHRTPLHCAVETEHLSVAELLLKSGARVDARHEPTLGNTPLGDVAATCSLATANLFVDLVQTPLSKAGCS